MHLLVKVAALIPDEAIEEDAEVSKNLKRLYEQVMKNTQFSQDANKDLQSIEFQEKKVDEAAILELKREKFYKPKSKKHVAAFIEDSDRFSQFRSTRDQLSGTISELDNEL